MYQTQWIQTLANEERSAGGHAVAFAARELLSGVYSYGWRAEHFYARGGRAAFVENVRRESRRYTWEALVGAIEKLAAV